MHSMKSIVVAISIIASVLLLGCEGKEYTYVENQELKPGPGLFSGEDGVFTIYRDSPSSKKKMQKETDQK